MAQAPSEGNAFPLKTKDCDRSSDPLCLKDPDLSFLAEPAPKIYGFSGGSDSLSLLLMMVRARMSYPKAGSLIAVIVDHAYREESASEALSVQAMAHSLGVTCEIKKRQTPLPSGNLQAFFRHIRREALFEAALVHGANRIILAHHLDDQLETCLQRQRKASGIFGLAGMAIDTPWRHLLLTRPALPLRRQTLHQALVGQTLTPCDDRSNYDSRFERVRLRKELAISSPDKLLNIFRSLSQAEQARTQSYNKLSHHQKEHLIFPEWGVIGLKASGLNDLTKEECYLFLRRILLACGGSEMPVARASLDRLIASLNTRVTKSVTLAGCTIRMKEGEALIRRESGRIKAYAFHKVAGRRLWLDGRFFLNAPRSSPWESIVCFQTFQSIASHYKPYARNHSKRQLSGLPIALDHKNEIFAPITEAFDVAQSDGDSPLEWPAGKAVGFKIKNT